MTPSIIWGGIALVIAAVLYFGTQDKNNNVKNNGINDNFVIND